MKPTAYIPISEGALREMDADARAMYPHLFNADGTRKIEAFGLLAAPEPWGIEGARHALARGPEANPDQDPAVLRLELDAAQQEIARLRGLLNEAQNAAADLNRSAEYWQRQAARGAP